MKWLTTIRKDLWLHFLVSFAGVLIVSYFVHLPLAVIIVLVGGILKEAVWDFWLKRGHGDAADLVANVIGVWLAVLVLNILYGFGIFI